MKKRLLKSLAITCLLSAATMQGQIAILIGWDDAPDTGSNVPVANYAQNHQYVAGITGLINDGRQAVTFQGSTDGTYGPLAGPPNPTATSGRFVIYGAGNNAVDDRITISITNNTGSAYELDALVFDFSRQFTNGAQDFVVNYISSLSNNSLGDLGFFTIYSQTGLAVTGANDDLPDYSASISTALADNVLGDGETAVFRIIGSNAPGFSAAVIDNIAFTGQMVTVPEASTFALLTGFAALGLVLYRRRGK
jgi:hypothetical protein